MFKARFAPSPTGMLHIGNARSAVINYAFIKKLGGQFILRIDDTDLNRSEKKYENNIKNDLSWLGIKWSKSFNQSCRFNIYDKKIIELKNKNRLYPCFETEEELSLKRKSLLSSGKPPIYDRGSLNLSQKEINNLIEQGKKPHWRFKLQEGNIIWNDIIKGKISFNSKNISDPILIREDGSFLYHLPSVIDDIEENITHIIRGEDHINNTACHIQLFQALNSNLPEFGHHPFLTDEKGKGFAKRINSLSINSLMNEGFENITLINYLLSTGTSKNFSKEKNIEIIIKNFDIQSLAKSSPKFSINELKILNKEILKIYNYNDVKNKYEFFNINDTNQNFWNFVKNNINFFKESFEWLKIVKSDEYFESNSKNLLLEASRLLPEEPYDDNTWDEWIKLIKNKTGKGGKDLFLPIRIALTGKEIGPELKYLIPLLSKEHILKKLGQIK